MRKLIWCCSAAAVLAAGSFLSLAYYAYRWPDSLVGRSMQVIAEASIAMQPLNGLTSLAVRTNQAHTPPQETAGSMEECVPADPQPIAPEPAPQLAQGPPVVGREFNLEVDAAGLKEVDAAPIVIGEEEPMPREDVIPPVPADRAVVQGQEVPAKGSPIVMPYCKDDDEPDVPPTMPRADAAEETEDSVFKEWMKLFEEGKENRSPAVEELPAPAEEEESPTEPKCQEDSHLHEHYPGCPRTTCPYTGKSYPSPKGGEENSEEPPHPGKKPHRRKGGKEECPRTQGVDTMEYRPSDAGLDEYGPGPLH